MECWKREGEYSMTPAITLLEKSETEFRLHQYVHDSDCSSYGAEAAEKLDVDERRIFKTLVSRLDSGELVVAVIPVGKKLDLKNLAKSCDSKKAKMASTSEVEKTTGYVVGGVSPLGQKKRLTTLVDVTASDCESVFVSGGKRGLEIELSAHALIELTDGAFAPIGK